jgi:hypothetical protein
MTSSFLRRLISYENWSVLCDSLGIHTTVECLDLRFTAGDIQDTAQKPLLKMLQVNTLLKTIELEPAECDMRIFNESDPSTPREYSAVSFGKPNPWRVAFYSVNGNPTLEDKLFRNNLYSFRNVIKRRYMALVTERNSLSSTKRGIADHNDDANDVKIPCFHEIQRN